MLVVSRKPGEKLLIGDSVAITVVRIGPNTVRLGVEAPRDINIVREELVVTACELHGGSSWPVGGGDMAAEDLGSSVLARQLRGEQP